MKVEIIIEYKGLKNSENMDEDYFRKETIQEYLINEENYSVESAEKAFDRHKKVKGMVYAFYNSIMYNYNRKDLCCKKKNVDDLMAENNMSLADA